MKILPEKFQTQEGYGYSPGSPEAKINEIIDYLSEKKEKCEHREVTWKFPKEYMECFKCFKPLSEKKGYEICAVAQCKESKLRHSILCERHQIIYLESKKGGKCNCGALACGKCLPQEPKQVDVPIKTVTKAPNPCMEKAILLAINNGWKTKGDHAVLDEEIIRVYEYFEVIDSHNLYQSLLDPLFWQALGRGLGWRQDPSLCTGCKVIGYRTTNHMNDCLEKSRPGSWNDNWHRFIDHLIEGKSIDLFFESLLP